MTNRTTRLSALVAALLFVGCGDGGSTPKEGIGQAYVETICEMAARCPGSDFAEVAVLVNLFESGTPGSCERLLNSAGYTEVPSELEGVEDGTIAYDGAALDRCLRRLARECIPFEGFRYLEECRGVFTGQLAVGETCRIDAECAPGTYCDTELTCAGTCAPQVARGAACEDDAQCPSEGDALGDCRTIGEDSEASCTVFEVRSGAALGEPCGEDDDGELEFYTACNAGLYCRYGESQPTCAEPLTEGELCDEFDFCLNGYCDEGICRTGTLRTEAGETCDLELGIFCDGARHLGCSDDGICVEVGDGKLGSPCTFDGDPYLTLLTCDDNLYCDTTDLETAACQVRRLIGAECEGGVQCESGVCDDGICAPYEPICSSGIEI